MTTVLVILHVLVSFLLIFIVLIQGGKGAELGAAFGAGSSQTLFGGRGAATLLNKMTTVVAVVFMVTSLLLAIASTRTTSVIKETAPQERGAAETGPAKLPPAAEGQAPSAPAPEAPATGK